MGRTMVVAAIAAVAAMACEASEPSSAPTPASTSTRGSPITGGGERSEWVAVFDVSGDPRELEDDTEELMRTVPDSLIVGPVGCHGGLAERIGASPSDYFSGVVGASEAELDRAVDDARMSPMFGPPVFRGELDVLC